MMQRCSPAYQAINQRWGRVTASIAEEQQQRKAALDARLTLLENLLAESKHAVPFESAAERVNAVRLASEKDCQQAMLQL